MSTPLQNGKMGLCQILNQCDGPFLLPCGHKKDDPSYCETWKKIPLANKDLIIGDDDDDIYISRDKMESLIKWNNRGDKS